MLTQISKQLFSAVFGMLLLMALAACTPIAPAIPPAVAPAAAPTDGENQLAGTNWTLVSVDGTEVGNGMTLGFLANTLSGSDGCNTFSSDYTVENGSLTISDNMVSTLMACPDMDVEMAQQYLNALISATAFTHDNDSLTIQTESGELAFAPMANAELDGTRWQLTSLADRDGNITRMPIDRDIFIVFHDGQANGNGGCNSFSGDVTTDATQMSFGNIASTLMACGDEEVGQRETEFFMTLGNIATYEIVAQMLTLYDAEGATVATFVASEEMAVSAGLTDTVWQWVRFEDTAGINDIHVDSPTSYTIQFMADGTYGFQADCNSGNGSYTHGDSGLAMDPGPVTLAACGDESLGDKFVRLLGDVATYVFDGDGNLVMNLKMDAGNMVFTAAE